MNEQELKNTREIKIIEPNTLYDTYKGLVLDYRKEIMHDYKNGEDKWFYVYYKTSYERLINLCNEFIDGEYELNIPFTNACKLYNHMSKDFGRFLKIDTELTKELTDLRINYVHLKLDSIKGRIFKKKDYDSTTQYDLKLLNELSNKLTKEEIEDLTKYINICMSRGGTKTQK